MVRKLGGARYGSWEAREELEALMVLNDLIRMLAGNYNQITLRKIMQTLLL